MLNSGGFFLSRGYCHMKYDKQSLPFSDQADQLIRRGMVADRSALVKRLQAVNYYRLSGYWYSFRIRDENGVLGDDFLPGTTFETVWRRYAFDRRLRMIVMDAIERIEVAVRTQLTYFCSQLDGPFGYVSESALPKLTSKEYADWLCSIAREEEHSKESFVAHFRERYGDHHRHLPLWMAVEVLTFGGMLTLFKGVAPSTKRVVSEQYGIADEVLLSWLRSLNAVRNICAHHGRLWNRELGYKPLLPSPNKHPDWHEPVAVGNNRVFVILTICRYMLRIIAPQSQWSARLSSLLAEYPEVPATSMGFPDDWRSCPIWKEGMP